jgi:hypothetical protein
MNGMALRSKIGLALLCVLIVAGCGPAAPEAGEPLLLEPVNTPTLSPTAFPPAEIPSPEPPSPTATPAPTSTPTLPPPVPQSGGTMPGVWIGQPTYVESQPGMAFQVLYDDTLWEYRSETEMGLPGLVHRLIPGCVLFPTVGRGLSPEWTVEHTFRTIGERTFEVALAYRNGQPEFASYYGGDGIVFTGFQVSFAGQMDACLQDAELVLATLTSTPAPTQTP